MKPGYLGVAPLDLNKKSPRGSFVNKQGERWYCIKNYDRMPAFFLSITSPEDFWMFLSSTGGLTCGRGDSDNALFPYSTDDRVSRSIVDTGPFTALWVSGEKGHQLWQPLDLNLPPVYNVERSLYKSPLGDRIRFEELNLDLGLSFIQTWESSPQFGFLRRCYLQNLLEAPQEIRIIDGLRNILPAGVTDQTQASFSNLLNAYKRNESISETALGIFALSATLTDQAEPSESLQATTVWSYGMDDGILLLSEGQIPAFLEMGILHSEEDIKGERGAYFRSSKIQLNGQSCREWGFCAELKQDHRRIYDLQERLLREKPALIKDLQEDVEASSKRLESIIQSNDGMQEVGSRESAWHHQANVLFNIMRGGYFIEGYQISSGQFRNFLQSWNRGLFNRQKNWLEKLPDFLTLVELRQRAQESGDSDLERLVLEYLPLTFGRRHGDPSRPWNRFSIETRDEKGAPLIGYQGNWRDIFQNWEALCFSFPRFYPSVIAKFLNATTIDGYNPYRISQLGFDWETPNPDDPWANIGYWSDHQIVYLSRLLEQAEHFNPGALRKELDRPLFVFADVPYRIKNLEDLLRDPYNSIDFDRERHKLLEARFKELGADGKLLTNGNGEIQRTGMAEKLLILLLAKLANFVPGGGIWMNTQRPEWNDANNALAGWGLSLVTLCYLIRFLDVLQELFPEEETISLHKETDTWLEKSLEVLKSTGAEPLNEEERFYTLSHLGRAASDYRVSVYSGGYSGATVQQTCRKLHSFFGICREQFWKTLEGTGNPDGTFESYQVLQISGNRARIKQLYPMLEGQVAGLSVRGQDPGKVDRLLETLRQGPLYREDQHSYMLYPNRELPRFLEKNSLPPDALEGLQLAKRNREELEPVLQQDLNGLWHFSASFRNKDDLIRTGKDRFTPEEMDELIGLFEEVFHHSAFTGRSGTFFAYEGLGSIYWHMVSKLLLAVQEQLIDRALQGTESDQLRSLKERYLDIRRGLGFNKSPEVYGAFPCDPYSHSPWRKGAKQPGMTGQVKEEILTRYAELGLVVRKGRIRFIPDLILEDQWTDAGTIGYTFCGVPVEIRKKSEKQKLSILMTDGSRIKIEGLELNREISERIFLHSREVQRVELELQED